MGMTAHPHPHHCCSQFLPSWLLFQWGEWCRRRVVVDVEQRVTCQIVTITSIVSKNSIKLNLKLRKTHPPFEGKRPVETGWDQSFTGPRIPKIVRTKDRTTVFGLLRSWEFAVLIGLGPVQSRSFSGFETGLPNTRPDQSVLQRCRVPSSIFEGLVHTAVYSVGMV